MLNDRSSLLGFLKSRKSASAKALTAPGPGAAQTAEMLEIALRVPDHGKLCPWRLILFEGPARAGIGAHFAARWRDLHPEHAADAVAFQRALFERAPLVIAVVSRAAPHAKIPEWEQQMSAAAVCFNLELAAMALGFDCQWQTDWVAYDPVCAAAMGLRPPERIAGLIYIGTSSVPLEDRPRPAAADLVTRWVA